MITRRKFISGSAALAVVPRITGSPTAETESLLVNDIHSQLNATRIREVLQPHSLEDVQTIIRKARKNGRVVSVAGGRHAMGGQQFCTGGVLIDVRKMGRLLSLDRRRGVLEVEAGIEWPELIDGYLALQKEQPDAWGIARSKPVPTV